MGLGFIIEANFVEKSPLLGARKPSKFFPPCRQSQFAENQFQLSILFEALVNKDIRQLHVMPQIVYGRSVSSLNEFVGLFDETAPIRRDEVPRAQFGLRRLVFVQDVKNGVYSLSQASQ